MCKTCLISLPLLLWERGTFDGFVIYLGSVVQTERLLNCQEVDVAETFGNSVRKIIFKLRTSYAYTCRKGMGDYDNRVKVTKNPA